MPLLDSFNWQAFAMASVAGLSTGIGGLLSIFNGEPSPKSLGYMTSFSCGVMLYISFMDLLPEAITHIGFAQANVAFFVGMLIFGLMAHFIPSHEHPEDEHTHKHNNKSTDTEQTDKSSQKKGKSNEKTKDEASKQAFSKKESDNLKRVGLLTALSISMHNFPEGIAVYLACLKGLEVGFPIAIAIAAHNIPEGMAVATPLYHSTGSKWQAIKVSLLSGICEPVAAFTFGVFLTEYITDEMVQVLLASVAGIMVLVSLKELLPVALEYLSPQKAMLSNALGMLFISLSIYALHASSGHDHSQHNHTHSGHDHHHHHSENTHGFTM